ncbi:MAG: beta-glucosidase [Spirochaetes bacterium]|nr:MAG: beta-glucosidase [Spirochaetota bacterium]
MKLKFALFLVLGVFACALIAQAGEMETIPWPGGKKSAKAEKAMPVEVKKTEAVFGGTKMIPGAMKGEVFFIPEDSGSLPDFSVLKPNGTIYTKTLNVEPRSFDTGFPGISDRTEWFAIRYTGSFTAAAEGDFSFRVLSDDGSRVYIDETLVVDNDGVHPPSELTGTIKLTKGKHAIRVEFFQGPRYELALQLFVTTPGGTERIFESD